ncbi:MAG TPA: zf-HC2 domain-containing protein [Candidatus Elarobacter sp.]|jgi:anti-sigma factor RsiW|nr:zf-HC2 domain-containing protein [Candidatus Elarobacter sp.]
MTIHYDRETLIDYLHGALTPEADAVLFAHLETCRDCDAVYNEEAALGEVLRQAARTEELEFPSMVKARVWDAVRREKPTWVERLRTSWGPRIAVPVAAAVAIAAYVGTPYLRQPAAATGIEAAYYLDEHNAEAQQNPFGPGVAPAVYTTDTQDRGGAASSAASYIDTADAATLVDADGAFR